MLNGKENGFTFKDLTIKEPKGVDGWKEWPIEENGEKLVLVNEISKELVDVYPYYFKSGIKMASDQVFLREGVVDRLLLAARLLPHKCRLIVFDGWRSTEVQQALFDEFKGRLSMSNSDWDEERLLKETQKYVSLPSTNLSRPAPHLTGGAVDLTVEGPNGSLLDMGTDFDHFGIEASLTYAEDGRLGDEVRTNRRFLYHAMFCAGFSGYGEEWWHFDFGNQFDAVRTGKKVAIYGAAK